MAEVRAFMSRSTNVVGEARVTAEALAQARRVLDLESTAISRLHDGLGAEFLDSVGMIARRRGRVVVTGMGKAGLIGRKLASTFASLGIPAFFLHPAEGAHGDVGMMARGDVVLAVSNSGETEEISR